NRDDPAAWVLTGHEELCDGAHNQSHYQRCNQSHKRSRRGNTLRVLLPEDTRLCKRKTPSLPRFARRRHRCAPPPSGSRFARSGMKRHLTGPDDCPIIVADGLQENPRERIVMHRTFIMLAALL